MSENVSIDSPVEIKDNSKERVAFDLAMRIAFVEELSFDKKKYRKELLKLYGQCLKITINKSNKSKKTDFEKMI